MRIEVATLGILFVLVMLLTGCSTTGHKPNEVQTTQVIYRDKLVPAPCPEKVHKPKDPLLGALTMDPEGETQGLINSDSTFRQYVPSLERAAKACGVTILAD
jgi:hypothetical protein